ncbi:unnamed protein product [Ixodes pacificus]
MTSDLRGGVSFWRSLILGQFRIRTKAEKRKTNMAASDKRRSGHQPGSGGVYGGTAERLCEKPPPYPGNNYPPASGIGFHVPQESLYYPATK